jgi:pyridoxamine 5'-phosphate oxidase
VPVLFPRPDAAGSRAGAAAKDNDMQLPEIRKEYTQASLRKAGVEPDPIRQFQTWLTQALGANIPEPNAMTLATATPDGRPSARVVLLRGIDEAGFTFHTNYESRKGRELAGNPWAALVFYWPALERQVRVEGTVERLPPAESDAYFRTRPTGSRLGAWASPQSSVVPSREALEQRLQEVAREYEGREVPRPPFWGGYRLRPVAVEFWQGRPNRFHDRLLYRRLPSGAWQIERLAP